MSKWKGIKFRSDYKPHRFNHRGKSYVWDKLTADDIAELAADPNFTLFHNDQPQRKAPGKGRRGPEPGAEQIDNGESSPGE